MSSEYTFTPADPFRMVIEEGKVHEFARATHSRCPEHLRTWDPISPITFLASHRLWMEEQNSAWRGIRRDMRGVLHGEEEFVFHTMPPVAGTVLTARQFVERNYEKQGRRGGAMTFTELVTRFWTESEDDPIAEERTVTIRRHVLSEPGGTSGSSPASPTAPAPTGSALFERQEPPLTVTDFVKYQGASGDFNPIHHDTAFAARSGYPSPFAVGMLAAGIAANLVSEYLGGEERGSGRVRRLRTRWHDQAWPGDALIFRGIRLDNDRLQVDVFRPNGALHLVAWADSDA